MDIAIVGSGTIGLTYGWLLSKRHGVTHVVRPERSEWYREPFALRVADRRKAAARRKVIGRREPKGVRAGKLEAEAGKFEAGGEFAYLPRIASDPEEVKCDVVLVMTDRLRLAGSLETVRALARSGHVVFMLNHWDLPSQADGLLRPEQYSLGFPGQVGGGRDGRTIEVWGEATTQWVQVFTAPHRDSVAVEPMTCGPDAFNEGPTYRDRIMLRPGDSANAVWGVRVHGHAQ